MLAAPALLGFVAERHGIRVTFALLAPVLLASLALVRELRPRTPR